MRKLFLSALSVNLLVVLVNFVTGIVSARVLGPSGRGMVAAATRWPSLLAILFTFGLPGAVIYLGKINTRRQGEYLGAYLVVGSATGVLGAVVGCTAVLLSVHGSSELLDVVLLGMMSVPFGVLSDGLIGTLQSLNKFRHVMYWRIIVPLSNLLVILVLILLGIYNPVNYMLASLLWGSATFSLLLAWVFREVAPSTKKLLFNTKELLIKGMQIYAGSVTSVLGGNVDQLVVSLFLNSDVLGTYAVAASVASVIPSVVIGAFAVFLWPRLMDDRSSQRLHKFEQIHAIALIGACLIVVVVIAGLPLLLPFVYGMKFTPSVVLGQLLLVGAPFGICYSLVSILLSTYGRFKVIALIEGVGLVTVLSIFLASHETLGAEAAAVGVTVASIVKWCIGITASRSSGLSVTASLWVSPTAVKSILFGSD